MSFKQLATVFGFLAGTAAVPFGARSWYSHQNRYSSIIEEEPKPNLNEDLFEERDSLVFDPNGPDSIKYRGPGSKVELKSYVKCSQSIEGSDGGRRSVYVPKADFCKTVIEWAIANFANRSRLKKIQPGDPYYSASVYSKKPEGGFEFLGRLGELTEEQKRSIKNFQGCGHYELPDSSMRFNRGTVVVNGGSKDQCHALALQKLLDAENIFGALEDKK